MKTNCLTQAAAQDGEKLCFTGGMGCFTTLNGMSPVKPLPTSFRLQRHGDGEPGVSLTLLHTGHVNKMALT